jgi:hypothetical protein
MNPAVSSACPICGNLMLNADTVVDSNEGLAHSHCAARTLPTLIQPSEDDEALVAAVASMLDGRLYDADKTAREVTQVLLSRFHITKRG